MGDSSSDDEIEFLGVKPAAPIEIIDDNDDDDLPIPDGVASLSNTSMRAAAATRTTTSTSFSSAQRHSQQHHQRQRQQQSRQQQQSRWMANFTKSVRDTRIQPKKEQKPPPPYSRYSSAVQRPQQHHPVAAGRQQQQKLQQQQQQQLQHRTFSTQKQQQQRRPLGASSPWKRALLPRHQPQEWHSAFSLQQQQQLRHPAHSKFSSHRPALPKENRTQQQRQRMPNNNFVDLCGDSDNDNSISNSIEQTRRYRRRCPASGPFARVTAAAGTHQEPIVLLDEDLSSSSDNDDDDDSSSSSSSSTASTSSSSAASHKTFRFDDDDEMDRKPAALPGRKVVSVPSVVRATTAAVATTAAAAVPKQVPQRQETFCNSWDSSDDELDMLRLHVTTKKKAAMSVVAAAGTAVTTAATSNNNAKKSPISKTVLRAVPKAGRSARALQAKSVPAPMQPPSAAAAAKKQAVALAADSSKKNGAKASMAFAFATATKESSLPLLQKPATIAMKQRPGGRMDGALSLYSADDKHKAMNKSIAALFGENKKSNELQSFAVNEEAKGTAPNLLPKKRPAEPESPRDVKKALAGKKLNVHPGLVKYSPQRKKIEPAVSSRNSCQDLISIESDSGEASGGESVDVESSSLSNSKQGSAKDTEDAVGQVNVEGVVKLRGSAPSQLRKATTAALELVARPADNSPSYSTVFTPSATLGSRTKPKSEGIRHTSQQLLPLGMRKAEDTTGFSHEDISASLQGSQCSEGGFMREYVRGERNAENSAKDGVSGDNNDSYATCHQEEGSIEMDRLKDSLPSLGQNSSAILENPDRPTVSAHDESDLDTDFEVDYEDEDPELPMSMSMASSHKSIENGLPVWRFSVYAGSDEILYDFKIHIGPSSIPNSGLGAFLTYMGARILKDECRELSARIIEESTFYYPLTMTPLVADLVGGTREMVRLTGDNLHGNYNSVYWPNTSDPIKAKVRKNALQKSAVLQKQHDKVQLVGRGMQSHPELENRPKDGIGHLGLHTDSDYEPVSGITFSENLCIDLGIYGPLSYTDRKEAFLFDAKSFLFSDEPGEWAYGVVENLRGKAQIVDITSDLTGKPHKAAREEIPMYVNEIGHDHSKYTQNVFVGESDNRTVHYFFRTTKTLHGSHTVELLTNYRHTYETSRERKGYGLKNIYRGDKSDDDRASRLRRNLRSRSHIEEKLSEVSLPEIYRHLKYIFENIWTPLSMSASEFLDRSDDSSLSPLSCLQWKALFRLNWLAGKFLKRIDALKEELSGTSGFRYHEGFHRGCKGMLEQIDLAPTPRLLSGSLLDSSGQSVRQAVLEEVTEEMFFEARDRIRLPFNKSLWCQVGCDFLETLSRKIAEIGFGAGNLDELRSVFCETAKSSMQRIEECALDKGDKLKELAFESGTRCTSLSYASMKLAADTLRGFDSHCFLGHDTTPKALQAALIYFLEEEMFYGGKQNNPGQLVHLEAQGGLIMVQMNGYRGPPNRQSQNLASVPRSLSIIRGGSNLAVNKMWYHVWQVLYVAHVFASSLVPQLADGIIQELCSSFDLDSASVYFAINRGIRSGRNAAWDAFLEEAEAGPREEFDGKVQAIRKKAMEKIAQLDAEAVKRGGKANWRKFVASKVAYKHKHHPTKGKVAKAKKTHTTKHKTSTSGGRCGMKAPLVYEGPPTTKLPDGWKWPEGWSQKTYQRKGGATAGRADDYFFSPKLQVKLRSKRDVVRFLERLEQCNGDEEALMRACFKST